MGLNLKVLAAPLTNRVHLVTIVVSAVLFGVFRLAGGELGMKALSNGADRGASPTSTERTSTVRRPAALDQQESQLDSLLAKSPRLEYGKGDSAGSAERAPAAVRAPSRLSERSPNLDELVDVGSAPPPRQAPSRPREAGGLNDIEKQLGLR
jgi:hypothetical protein